ncbi:endonuclease/exonuclease/phosphatase family protein [Yoonia maritima]|uniref:endonuclease/exonuclease/phosphatase family protein n=1 Tax=Yoonia maritima TaxID=1435347 RepID=UPI001EF996CD|nr:endonuclease/exonuclease/phosphatase family protein [Yoonia maritima]
MTGTSVRKALKYLLIGLLSLFVTACVQLVRNSGVNTLSAPSPAYLRIATLNVHYIVLRRQTGAWSLGDWERRKVALDLAFKAIAPDVIGFQEMESFAGGDNGDINLGLDWLLSQNPSYEAAAVGDWRRFPSTQPILYRDDRLNLIDQGWFFFSDTPDVIYSRTFNGSYPAFASWAAFSTDDGKRFKVINVHFEYKSRSNRLQSAALVAARIQPWIDAGENVVVLGDLNARNGARTQSILAEVGITFNPVKGSTYHFNRGLNLFGAIDHIGATADFHAETPPVVLRQEFNGEWPTDHYPVVVDYTISR